MEQQDLRNQMAHQVSSQSIDTPPSRPLLEPKEIISNNDDDHTQLLQQRSPSPKRHQDHDQSDKNDTKSLSSNNTNKETALQGSPSVAVLLDLGKETSTSELGLPGESDSGRERLKRHRSEVAGRVWIPDMWGQEELLKDWIDCSAFDASLVPTGIMSARAALVLEGRRANSSRLRIENRC